MSYHPAGGVGTDPGFMPPPGPSIPAPPQGPGAAPPFAVPPTERDKRRMWRSIGIGIAVLLLCCTGAAGGIGVIIYSGVDEAKRQAKATVNAFLGAVHDGDARGARQYVCEDPAQGVNAPTLVSRAADTDFSTYTFGDPDANSSGIDVPVTLTTPRGDVGQLYLVGSEQASNCILDILTR
jgi:hypothetical protein